jgi:hypothetical protein
LWYLDVEVAQRDIAECAKKYPQAVWLCITNKAVSMVNNVCTELFISNERTQVRSVLTAVIIDGFLEEVQLVQGMPVMVLENLDVEGDLVNGGVFSFLFLQDSVLVLEDENHQVKMVELMHVHRGGRDFSFFPVRVAFAQTIYKAQGSTLQEAVLWMDSTSRDLLEGVAYVAFSRVRFFQDLHIFGRLRTRHFVPCCC